MLYIHALRVCVLLKLKWNENELVLNHDNKQGNKCNKKVTYPAYFFSANFRLLLRAFNVLLTVRNARLINERSHRLNIVYKYRGTIATSDIVSFRRHNATAAAGPARNTPAQLKPGDSVLYTPPIKAKGPGMVPG